MIHWVPVADSPRSFCSSGIAKATIVWSMNVIDTAKIIAARTRVFDPFMAQTLRGAAVGSCPLARSPPAKAPDGVSEAYGTHDQARSRSRRRTPRLRGR